MKRGFIIFSLILLLSFSVCATDFFAEYEMNNNLYEAYKTDTYDMFSTADSCVALDNMENSCFNNIKSYRSSSLPLKKDNLMAIRVNVQDLMVEYVIAGGVEGDGFYNNLDQLQSKIGLLVLEVEDKVEVIGTFIDEKYEEQFLEDYDTYNLQYLVLQDQLDSANTESSFNSVQSQIESLQSEISALESEVQSYLNNNPGSELNTVSSNLDTLSTNVDGAVAESYGEETVVDSTETSEESSGFTFTEGESSTSDIENLLEKYLSEKTTEVVEGKTSSTSDLELLLALLKEIDSMNQNLETEKGNETDPLKLSELNDLSDKNTELYYQISGIIEEEYGDIDIPSTDLVKISTNGANKQREAPKGIADLITFLVLGVVLLGVLYSVFRKRSSD